MTFAEFRGEMNAFWESANRRAMELKDPFDALERTASMYSRLDAVDREYANRVFDEWLLADDEAKRYVAVALIRQFNVTSAVPALQALADKLLTSNDPGAPFEREKVDVLLRDLGLNGTATP